MDVHKPKPWHGGPEFLKEIGTIVIGVLIALGAEQAAEWWHWRADVSEAREALRDEVRADAMLSKVSVEESHCMADNLADFGAWARGGARPELGDAVLSSPSTAVWDVAKAGQTLSHMPLRERLAFARFYAGAANQQGVIQMVRTAGSLQILRYIQKTELTPDEARRLPEDIAVARTLFLVRGRNDAAQLKLAKALGVDPGPLPAETQARLTGLCKRRPAQVG